MIMENLGMANWIAIASCIVGALSAFGTLMTVLHMKNQRKESLKPRLVFGSVEFDMKRLKKEDDSPSPWEFLTNSEHIKRFKLSNSWDESKLATILANIGLGTARDVKITWSFDFKEMARILNTVEANTMEVREGGFIVNDEDDGAFFVWGSSERALNFIRPSIDEKIVLPASYLILIFIYYKKLLISLDKCVGFDIFPPLEVCVEYLDISNNFYKNTFYVHINTSGFSDSNLKGDLQFVSV
jgi:hypothetical protein